MTEYETDDHIQGTCTTMCPEQELRLRQREGLLHKLECVHGQHRQRRPPADPDRTVKMYSRPAAGRRAPLPSDLRTPEALLKTVHYLLTDIIQRQDISWVDKYEFIFDRLRAVRQDLVIQRIMGETAIHVLEAAVSFHIIAAYKLCGTASGQYDHHINTTHQQECLKRLLCLYQFYPDPKVAARRPEFETLYLLCNLTSQEALHHALTVRNKIRPCKQFALALEMGLSLLVGNQVRAIRLSRKLSPLARCAFFQHLTSVQSQTLKIMSHGYNSKQLSYPSQHLAEILSFPSVMSAEEACKNCGLSVNGRRVIFQKAAFTDNKLLAQRQDELDQRTVDSHLPYLLCHITDDPER